MPEPPLSPDFSFDLIIERLESGRYLGKMHCTLRMRGRLLERVLVFEPPQDTPEAAEYQTLGRFNRQLRGLK